MICQPDEDGWITWLRRVDDSVSFNRTWDEYVRGFGDPEGNYWLGLKALHQLTGTGRMKYRMWIEIESFIGLREWAEYKKFSIGDVNSRYQLNIGEFTGNTNNAFVDSVESVTTYGQRFTTWDEDNDNYGTNCVIRYASGGGWWYNACGLVHLTGKYGEYPRSDESPSGYIGWGGAFGYHGYTPIKLVEAKIMAL